MEGTPPSGDTLVTLANWQEPPFNRWGFQHVRDLIPTARIARGDGPVWRLPRAERGLDDLTFRSGRRRLTLERMFEETATDGFLVLHRGRIVMERYFNAMTPSTTHLLMSVSKSLTSTLAGILVGRGELDPRADVTSIVTELEGTSFDGCAVQHLLDMRAGTRFDETYDDPKADVRVYEQVYLWRPRMDRRVPADATAYFATLKNASAHGGPFDYRSVLTDVLAWVIERAAGVRFAELVSRELWRPMGAEFDAEVTVDGSGNPMADGGICTTLRDLGRFGQLFLNGGVRGRRRIVPASWIRDIVRGAPDGADVFERDEELRAWPRGAHYRDKWWVYDPSGPIYQGLGINGQRVMVHRPSRMVVVKFSTWADALDVGHSNLELDACLAIADALAG